MALLLIVLALFGFVAAGVGSGSSGSGHVRSSTTVHFAPTAPKKPGTTTFVAPPA